MSSAESASLARCAIEVSAQEIPTETVTGMDGTSEVIETFMPTGLGILLTGVLVLMILLDLFCIYMLWFDRGVKEYLYDRSLRY